MWQLIVERFIKMGKIGRKTIAASSNLTWGDAVALRNDVVEILRQFGVLSTFKGATYGALSSVL